MNSRLLMLYINVDICIIFTLSDLCCIRIVLFWGNFFLSNLYTP